MAKSKKHNAKNLSYISVPSQIINSISSSSLQSLLDSPKKSSRNAKFFISTFTTYLTTRFPRLCFLTLFLLAFLVVLEFGFNLKTPFPPYPCAETQPSVSISNGYHSKSELGVVSSNGYYSKSELGAFSSEDGDKADEKGEKSGVLEFWKQPDGLGYRPCLDFSREYRRESAKVVKERRKYLMVVVSGGLNQQRNQIVDAVVIARILGAVLVVPILQVNVIWGDERYIYISQFGLLMMFLSFNSLLNTFPYL